MRRIAPNTNGASAVRRRSASPGAQVASSEARLALERARGYLLSLQRPDGHWVGELEGDTILESEYVLLRLFMGNLDGDRLRKLANYLRQQQLPTGGWALHPGGQPDVSSSVKAYLALRLAGLQPDHPELVRAREAILRLGGVTKANTFTKIYLAIFGQYDWEGTPVVPPELVLLPRWFYLNLAEISSWSRTILVPLAILSALRPRCELPNGINIDELFVGGRHGPHLRLPRAPGLLNWRNFFLTVDRFLHWSERHGWKPWRKKALRAAEAWMVARFQESGGLGAIFPPIVNALMAMRCLGYADDHPEVIGQWRELEAFEIEEDDTLRVQPCVSPVWDTGLATLALSEGGLAPDDPALQRAADWLMGRRIRKQGDWAVKRPNAPVAAWYFEYANEFYPDVDDTAAVLMALARSRCTDEAEKSLYSRQAIEWVFAHRGRDGGWASFDVDNDRMIFSQIPFADHNAMLDPSTADITARVLEMLSHYGYTKEDPRVTRAIEFLKQEQEPEGCWFGRWGVNYVYGTWQVLKGLSTVGEEMTEPYCQKGVEWLFSVQNPDGGWGESCASYEDPSLKGQGPSTASQTAWALMGLMAAGAGNHAAVRRGVEFLVRNQNPDGSWDEPWFTGTGFPKVFYLRYHLYRIYFPIFALGSYTRLQEAEPVGGRQTTHDGRRTDESIPAPSAVRRPSSTETSLASASPDKPGEKAERP
jgi:squalene-hopene/tetraprenyl-beta-curcumene cyclase